MNYTEDEIETAMSIAERIGKICKNGNGKIKVSAFLKAIRDWKNPEDKIDSLLSAGYIVDAVEAYINGNETEDDIVLLEFEKIV